MSCGCIYYRSNIKYMFEVELLNTIFINRASSILMLDDFFEKNWGFFSCKKFDVWVKKSWICAC